MTHEKRNRVAKEELGQAIGMHEAMLAVISEHMVDLMAIVDETGTRLFTSRSYITALGYAPEALAAMPPLDLIHPGDRERVREALKGVFEDGRPMDLEMRLRHQDGSWLDFESKGTLIAEAGERASRLLLVARDITARKKAEMELKAMEVQLRHSQKLEAIGSLAAGIAHEINTPIQYIGDNTFFLQDALGKVMEFLRSQRRFLQDHEGLPGLEGASEVLKRFEDLDLDYLASEVPRAIQQTLEGVSRVARIVRAMKDFSHPGGEDKVLADLNQSIENTVMVSRNEWKYVAEMELSLDPELSPMPCFPGEINQALLNLIVNAAHAIEEAIGGRDRGRKGLIRVTTRQTEDEILVSVSDDGMGIPQHLRQRIFDPFFTTKPVGKGTGQGLAIVHSVVVDKHGGRVELESEPGQGTTFHLHLPIPKTGAGLAGGA